MRISKTATGLMIGSLIGLMAGAGAQPLNTRPPPSEPYTWRNVTIGGGGFVTGIIFHPNRKDLLYARTDVGGAYRWDSPAQRWIPITDWVGPDDVNLTGIESIAVDASDPDRVYLAAGTYGAGRAAMLRSGDQGKTFQLAEVPFRMGGNETGRSNGERLAVDPNQGQILFFGSRQDGLWKSSDRGATWHCVEGFPKTGSAQASAPATDASTNARPRFGFGQQPAGIVCVAFDPDSSRPGHPTPQIYAAISTTETNLFRSVDAGASWEAVPGQPIGLRPNHLVRAPDGTLYLSYGREPGPNTMTDGAVWKYHLKDGAWTDITPVKPSAVNQRFGYGAVAVDAQHPAAILATTFCRWQPHDDIFRSTNGGATWTPIWNDNTQWDHSQAPYTQARTPHWMGDITINPFNSDQVWVTTGYGLWCCLHATTADSGRPTRWAFLDDGLEETVPLALISPPEGAHLLSGLGDIDGFRHDDLTVSPPATFAGPHFGNTETLAFAEKNPQVMARTGTPRARGQSRGAFSLDGGRSWQAFAAEPAQSTGAGSITVSPDGMTIVWTPRRSVPHYSADHGTHWTACAGLVSGLQVVADSVDPARFYACDPRAGKLFVSTNGAAGFSPVATAFPASQGFAGGFGGAGGEDVRLHTTPGQEGDLWLTFRAGGLFHSGDGGLSFRKLENVQQANSLGFGKAAPGRSYPTLYLAGRINQLAALFRSDDTGQTWVRINDDRHQFGWINHVTGDPRVYGRVYFGTGGRGVIYGDPDKK